MGRPRGRQSTKVCEGQVFRKDRLCTFETLVLELCVCSKSPNTPVIFQVGVCVAREAAEACRQVAGSVDGLGLNLGCSGLFSVQGGMGSALLENPSTEGDSCRDSRVVAVWHKACLGGPLHGTPLEQAEGPERGAEVV